MELIFSFPPAGLWVWNFKPEIKYINVLSSFSAGVFYTYFLVPETKDMTAEEIHMLFVKKKVFEGEEEEEEEEGGDTFSAEEELAIQIRLNMERRKSKADLRRESRNFHRQSFSHVMSGV
jgi:hypothetical protein